MELVERALCELVEIMKDQEMTNEERAFIRTTVLTVEDTLQRKFKIEDLADRLKA